MTNEELIHLILSITAEHEVFDDFFWKREPDGDISFWVNCNDIFEWATADAERITAENVEMLDQAYKDSIDYGGILFCARVRGRRPQGAVYTALNMDEETAALFDAAGPEREIDWLNPQRPYRVGDRVRVATEASVRHGMEGVVVSRPPNRPSWEVYVDIEGDDAGLGFNHSELELVT